MTHKTALVCGASQGIGAAVATSLAQKGCRILALARSGEKLKTLVQSLPQGAHQAMVADLADRKALKDQISAYLSNHGTIHILINNCGGPKPGPIAEAAEEVFLDGFQNHVLASSLLSQLVLPGMRSQGYGRIINIISTSVKVPIANLGVSNTIRGAMASWAKTLATESAPDGITVNNVLPGFTETPRLAALIEKAAARTSQTHAEVAAAWAQSVPARRFAKPEEVAAAVAFLASPSAGYVNGINLPVDGGRTGCL